MTTLEFAKLLATSWPVTVPDPAVADEIYRLLLLFLVDRDSGYGVSEGERGEAREFAESRGYFWLPCHLCGQWHGGHEVDTGSGIMLDGHSGVCVCKNCAGEAARLRKKYPRGLKG